MAIDLRFDRAWYRAEDRGYMRRPLRLLHTSDVHIGGLYPPDHGDHLRNCTCPISAIETMAQRHEVDAVLVAGDLFEHRRLDPEFVQRVLNRLGSMPMPCVVIAGNHDVHDQDTLYSSDAVAPTGVTFFAEAGGSHVSLLDGQLNLWSKAMPSHDRDFRPLADVPERPSDDAWWVVLGHGHFEEEPDEKFGRSSPLSSEQVAATGADYVALGHWHVRTDLSTDGVSAWYSGAPYGVASSGTMNLVTLNPADGTSVEHLEVTLPPQGCDVQPELGVLDGVAIDAAVVTTGAE